VAKAMKSLEFCYESGENLFGFPAAQESDRHPLTKMLGALTTKIFSNYAKLLQRAGHTLVAEFVQG
jgi:hypothetical protein